jgi:6-phospho-3-hexuloisomerase
MTTARHPKTIDVVAGEISRILAQGDALDFERFVDQLRLTRRRWSCSGQGRSGLVAQMAAMRLMHLGHHSHVVGEATAPAITGGDALLVFSASGTTPLSLHFAETARGVSAVVVLVTATAASPLRRLADATLEIRALASVQFGGSLFEQTALLVLDAAVRALDTGNPQTRDAMHRRHANLQQRPSSPYAMGLARTLGWVPEVDLLEGEP